MESTRINRCDIALAYAARGWSVIPLVPGGKVPLLSTGQPQIYQKRIPTTDEIKGWWKQWPDANIGIMTGIVSNLAVIDVDGEVGLRSASTLNLPSTLTVISGRLPFGSAKHLYYQYPAEGIRNDQNGKLGKKVDIRGDGGYVVAPCSLHKSGNYYTFFGGFQRYRDNPAPFPTKLLELLRGSREDDMEEVPSQEPWVTKLLQGVGEGERHQALVRLSGYFNSKGMPIDVTKALLLDWNTRCTPPYPGEKVNGTVEDIYKRYPSGVKADEIRPNNVPAVSTERQSVSVTSAKDAFASFKASLEERKKFKGAELSTGFPVLDGFTNGLARANLAVVGAWPGVGKTAWMLGVVKHLAESGHKVAYFPTEMSKNEVLKVLVSNGLSIPFDRVFKGEIDDDEMNRIERYMTGELLKNLEICEIDTPSLQDIQKTCRALKPDVLMLDYIQHTSGGQGSQREKIQEFVYGLKSISKELNAATLVSSQFRRPYKNDEGQPVPPTMFDFAECGQIEREVSFALLMSPTKERFEADLTYPVHFSLAKNRFGKVAEFELSFSQSYVRFGQ